MTEQVIYELGLRDKLSAGIDGATGRVNALERSLGSVKGLIGGIGIGLAAFKLADFAHDANREWDKMEFSMSQVEAAVKSTGGAAGLTFDELKKGAEETAHNLKFTQSEILGMQSVLLTFPSVTKQTFGEASAIIQDMSTRLGTDLKSSAIQVGKALQDPERGITALRRAGVNFSKDQQALIKTLVNTNRAAEAQALILKELQVEFGGSALAAAEADKSFRLDKTMEENKVMLGEMLDQLKEELMPVLIAVANGFKNTLHWIKENATGLKNLAIALGTAWVAFKVLSGASAIMAAIGASSAVAVTGIEAVGVASTVALGPIGLLAAAIGGVVFAYNQMVDMNTRQMDKAVNDTERSMIDLAKAEERAAVAGIKLKLEKSGISPEAAQKKAVEMQLESVMQQLGSVQGKDADKAQKLGEKMAALFEIRDEGLIPTKADIKTPVAGLGEKVKPDAKTKATGSKSVTINVTIQKLGETIINTTNIKEGAKELHDRVVAALTGAVNDFQIVASNS